jgi:hypothetical protein
MPRYIPRPTKIAFPFLSGDGHYCSLSRICWSVAIQSKISVAREFSVQISKFQKTAGFRGERLSKFHIHSQALRWSWAFFRF